MKRNKIESMLRAGLTKFGPVGGVYLLATLFTNAHFMGDTSNYTESIQAHLQGRYHFFLEFHHMLWRPLGWLAFRLCKPVTSLFVGSDDRANIILTLLTLNWLAGLWCVLMIYALARQLCRKEWVASLTAVAFIFTHGFLNYAQAGSSYIPGLALLLTTFFLLLKDGDQPERFLRAGIMAGATLAGVLCLWAPYVLVTPAALASPLLFHGFEKKRLKLVLVTALTCGLVAGLAFGAVALQLGIHDMAGVRWWMGTEGVSEIQINGVARVIFGFPRSFINMGNDGPLFKRYLVHDPFNPVSLADLLRLSLWKMGLFYLFLLAVTVNLLRSPRGRRIFSLLVLNAAPIIIFAIFLLGADIERYLGLYPLMFIAVAYALCSERALRAARYVILLFMAAAILTNVNAMRKAVLHEQEEKVMARIGALQAQLRPQSRVVTVNQQDELANFNRNFLFNPINKQDNLRIYTAVNIKTGQVAHWRQGFAQQALAVWQEGGEMWITKRVQGARPLLEWNWVEGDDPRVSWLDIHNFFAQFEMGQALGGADGFLLLSPSEKNRRLLESLAAQESAK